MSYVLPLECAKLAAMTTETKLTPPTEERPNIHEYVALGQALKLVIADKKLSQRKLAELTGIDVRRVNTIALGKGNPTYETLLRLCKGLGVRPRELAAQADKLLAEQDRARVSE